MPTVSCSGLAFRKSGYSGAEDQDCVKIAVPTISDPDLSFRKSSHGGGKTQDCVEVADTSTGAAIHDTKYRHLGRFSFGSAEWRAFLTGVKVERL